ncbi:MAG: uncharacterized protein KVP18_000884 [Porospora cf. gigantea A]|uniref:uncharacterized protein n=1 Tax=Porospora cf. gigantea A TaxID=2853593 RepID=UPI00355A1B8A|nr:MAG: hypothetical protein KVP18_000884 [Porospora cf. gigantea A]
MSGWQKVQFFTFLSLLLHMLFLIYYCSGSEVGYDVFLQIDSAMLLLLMANAVHSVRNTLQRRLRDPDADMDANMDSDIDFTDFEIVDPVVPRRSASRRASRRRR